MNLFDKLKNKIINFIRWVIGELKDWHTIVIFVIVCFVMYAPVWGGYGCHYLFNQPIGSIVATSYLVFWAGPFTPYFPICIAITLFIKRLIDKYIK